MSAEPINLKKAALFFSIPRTGVLQNFDLLEPQSCYGFSVQNWMPDPELFLSEQTLLEKQLHERSEKKLKAMAQPFHCYRKAQHIQAEASVLIQQTSPGFHIKL